MGSYSLAVSFIVPVIIVSTAELRMTTHDEEGEGIGMDLSPLDESGHQPDWILSGVSSALMSGESINPFANPATAAEGES